MAVTFYLSPNPDAAPPVGTANAAGEAVSSSVSVPTSTAITTPTTTTSGKWGQIYFSSVSGSWANATLPNPPNEAGGWWYDHAVDTGLTAAPYTIQSGSLTCSLVMGFSQTGFTVVSGGVNLNLYDIDTSANATAIVTLANTASFVCSASNSITLTGSLASSYSISSGHWLYLDLWFKAPAAQSSPQYKILYSNANGPAVTVPGIATVVTNAAPQPILYRRQAVNRSAVY